MDTLFNFSDMIHKLLKDENKDTLLGEISDELEQYIVNIKDMVESGEITYSELQEEISNNLNINEQHRPGSVAQMLVGCIDRDSCPMRQEEILDVPYFYDNEHESIIPITRADSAITQDSYAVIYLTGTPSDITPAIIDDLRKKGFNRLKIMFKESSTAKYKVLEIEDINSNIITTNVFDKRMILCALFLILLLIMYLYLR